MTIELDLLPVPAERDLPPGRLEQRAAALVVLVESGARPRGFGVLRSWLMSLALFAAVLGVVGSVVLAGGGRVDKTHLAAQTAVVLAGGSGLVAVAVAPRPARLAH